MAAKGFSAKYFNPNAQIFCDLTPAAAQNMILLTTRMIYITLFKKKTKINDTHNAHEFVSPWRAAHCCLGESLGFPF